MYRGSEVWRIDEVQRYGGSLNFCRGSVALYSRHQVEGWKGGVEARYRCRDVEACRGGGMECCRCVADVSTCQYGGMERWSRSVGVRTWRHGASELRSSGSALQL